MYKKSTEIVVGIFVIIACLALIFLAFKVSGLSFNSIGSQKYYQVVAEFSDIGSLQKTAAIRIAGVQVGVVEKIELNRKTFQAKIIMGINNNYNDIPIDTSASIQTAGILGESYIALMPGYEQSSLKNHSKIETTYSATNLSSLVSTFISGDKKK